MQEWARRIADWLGFESFWTVEVGLIAGVVGVAWLAHALLFWSVRRAVGWAQTEDDAFMPALRHPSRWVVMFLALRVVVPGVLEVPFLEEAIRQALTLGLIGSATWLALAAADAVETMLNKANPLDGPSPLRARRVRTQAGVLRRIASVLIVILGVGLALTTFPEIRQIGASVLASAGLAGIVLGLAARPVFENLIAGLQLAITAPIRIDDTVVVEGEWGQVEEIHSTFVVVRIWDQRRMVLPLTYFIETPFQNWTRSSPELIGPVFLHVDYNMPVDALRGELQRVLTDHPLWDGRVAKVQLTEATERTIQLRVLVSAANASDAWDLRCDVRERLVAYVQQTHPASLPTLRGAVATSTGEAS